MEFRWKKTEANQKFLIEKTDIQNLRVSHLLNVSRYKAGRAIVCIDETYCHCTITASKSWSNMKNCSLKMPDHMGQVSVLHADSKDEFVHNALKMFK